MLSLHINICNMDIGVKYGKLSVIREAPQLVLPSGQRNRAYLCVCDCGTEKVVRKLHLVRGRISSCGCLQRTQKGLSKHPLYKVWQSMLLRGSGHYDDVYRRKNISVCEEWKNFETFYNWCLKNKYKKGLQIDRIDNDGNYEPSNCRFVTSEINANNKDNTIYVVYNKKKTPLKLIVREKKLEHSYEAIIGRIKRGWNHQKAIDTPIRVGNYRRKQKPNDINIMSHDTNKKCFCHTCCKELKLKGLGRHLTMHRDKKEDCLIEDSKGEATKHFYTNANKNLKK